MKTLLGASAVALLGTALLSSPASAWWSVGIGVVPAPVVVAPPPVYYAPPYAYYPPPPYYAAPYPAPAPASPVPQTAQKQAQASVPPPPYGGTCYAGVYSCPAAPYTQVGGVCACPGLGAPSYGTAR